MLFALSVLVNVDGQLLVRENLCGSIPQNVCTIYFEWEPGSTMIQTQYLSAYSTKA